MFNFILNHWLYFGLVASFFWIVILTMENSQDETLFFFGSIMTFLLGPIVLFVVLATAVGTLLRKAHITHKTAPRSDATISGVDEPRNGE